MRNRYGICVVILIGFLTTPVHASWLDDLFGSDDEEVEQLEESEEQGDLTQNQASAGIKTALRQGAKRAIKQLGQPDGFLKDELVRIAVPEQLQNISDMARKLGLDDQVDELEVAMNRAAEQAVPLATDILTEAVKNMTVDDAIGIVRGGDTAGTDYFRRSSRETLFQAFIPMVENAMGDNQVAKHYDRLTEQYNKLANGPLGQIAGALGMDDEPRNSINTSPTKPWTACSPILPGKNKPFAKIR